MNPAQGPFSVLGLFDTPDALLEAIGKVKGRTGHRLEAYTPYPVHGLDRALGYRKSPIGGMVFVMGFIGALSALVLELWTSGWDYPLVTAGKPVVSWEAFVPILFEITVLFAALTAGLGMLLLLNRLPGLRHPMLRSRSMALLTRDRFGLAVESAGEPLDAQALALLLEEAGAAAVEVMEPVPAPGPASPKLLAAALGAILLACLAAAGTTYWGIKLFPRLIPMVHMLDQPRLDPQSGSPFFADGSGMRPPVAGTVSQGAPPGLPPNAEEASRLVNPLPGNAAVFRRGRAVYDTHCAVCHGLLGNGEGFLTDAYGARPTRLTAGAGRELSDGTIYHVIVTGKNAMPPYSSDLAEEERWAAVHYGRARARALDALDTDFEGGAR
jgi:mono/diheme cytochrome c family protein